MGQRVVVTGGAGFTGSNSVNRLLASGAEVLAIDNLATGHMRNLRLAESQCGFAIEQADTTDATTAGLIASYRPDVGITDGLGRTWQRFIGPLEATAGT